MRRASGQRKRIDPFGQLKMAFARVCDAAGVDMLALPVHFAIWFPNMAQSAFSWQPSPHIWTREQTEQGAVHAAIERALPSSASAAQSIALGQVVTRLRGAGIGDACGLGR
jgi:hypothetical protein